MNFILLSKETKVISDSGNVIFSCKEMSILNIDHNHINHINLNNNFDEDVPDTIILITQSN